MLETVTKSFSKISKQLRGQARLTSENMQATADSIKEALLDADVALSIADDFIEQVQQDVIGKKVESSMNPGQMLLGIVHHRLAVLMGGELAVLQLKKSPAIVMACGLQGVGKTTNLAKIAKYLKIKNKKRVLLASLDVRRKSAIEQLKILAATADVPYFESNEVSNVSVRAKQAVKRAQQELMDVLLIDTAGRTTLDEEMMDEIRNLYTQLNPSETLFFIDSMQGQDAINTVCAFQQNMKITGLVLTKFDGDSRGGSALAAKTVTGQPVKFVGIGEKIDDLELFHPDRYASRILGMGDIASLAEQIQDKTDIGTMRRFDSKIRKKPTSFNLNDQLEQIQQMKKMGGVSSVLDKLPGNMTEKFNQSGLSDSHEMSRMEAIILSMTPEERYHPEIIKASRKRRIAGGAATSVASVNQLLAYHDMTRKMLKKHMKNPVAMMRMLRQMFS